MHVDRLVGGVSHLSLQSAASNAAVLSSSTVCSGQQALEKLDKIVQQLPCNLDGRILVQSAFDLAVFNVDVLTGEELLHILSTSCILSQVRRSENSAVELVQALCDLSTRFFVQTNARPLFTSLYGSVEWFRNLCALFEKNTYLQQLFVECSKNGSKVLERGQAGYSTTAEEPEKISHRHPYRSIRTPTTCTALHDWYALGYQLNHLIEFVRTPELEAGIIEWQKTRRASPSEFDTALWALGMLQSFLRHDALSFISWSKGHQEVSIEEWKKDPEAISFKEQLLKRLDAQMMRDVSLHTPVLVSAQRLATTGQELVLSDPLTSAFSADPQDAIGADKESASVVSFKACLERLIVMLGTLNQPGIAFEQRYKSVHEAVLELVQLQADMPTDTRHRVGQQISFAKLIKTLHLLLCPPGFSL